MIYAMSDIHGCIEELKEKMMEVDLRGENRLIFLGDYLDYGESHYYIDGSVHRNGKLLLLGYDESKNKYYQMEKGRRNKCLN